jgi:hypothetical protein
MECTKEAIWLENMLLELGIINNQAVQLFVDNQSSFNFVRNPVFHSRTKYFEIHYHFSREKLEQRQIAVNYIPTADMPANIFTKALAWTKFEDYHQKLDVLDLPLI